MYVIRGLNLATFEAWDQGTYVTHEEATEKLEKLRKKRGPWFEDPVVYGVVNPEMKIKVEKKEFSLLKWLREVTK